MSRGMNFESSVSTAPAAFADGWHAHGGGPCPVARYCKVEVRYRNGLVSPVIAAEKRRWEAWPSGVGQTDWDIIAWRSAEWSGRSGE